MHVVALYLWIENEAHMNHLLMNRTTLVALLHVFVCCPQGLLNTWIQCCYFTVHCLFYLITLKTAIIQNSGKIHFHGMRLSSFVVDSPCHSNFDPIQFFVLMNQLKKNWFVGSFGPTLSHNHVMMYFVSNKQFHGVVGLLLFLAVFFHARLTRKWFIWWFSQQKIRFVHISLMIFERRCCTKFCHVLGHSRQSQNPN